MSDSGSQFSISRSSLLRMLGASSSSSSSITSQQAPVDSGTDDVPIGYQNANRGLAQRTQQLKVELAVSRRHADNLRAENERLRERIREFEMATDLERVELVLTERIKTKVGQLVHVAQHTVDYIEKSKANFQEVLDTFKDIDFSTANKENPVVMFPARKKAGVEPSLEKLTESPVIQRDEVPVNEEKTIVRKSRKGAVSKPQSPSVDETPRPPSRNRKAKSETRTPPTVKRRVNKAAEQSVSVGDDGPSLCDLKTPRVNLIANPRSFDTPLELPNPFSETDTVRRKRTVALKVKNYQEPSSGIKMRRPGKNDEVPAYISVSYLS